MLIPFMKVESTDIDLFQKFLNKSIEESIYSNFGPNEKKLTEYLEKAHNKKIILTTNATLILEGIHKMLGLCCKKAYLPGFTFPATNLGCLIDREYGETSIEGEMLGFSLCNNINSENCYVVTTAPFGVHPPKGIKRPNCKYWIIDNAAGCDPSFEKNKEWIDKGADIIICSLHATKILSACEGGFAVFNNDEMYREYKNYINFGFFIENRIKSIGRFGGSNHKMSELNASWCLSFIESKFEKVYEEKIEVTNKFKTFFNDRNVKFIDSPQAFWIMSKNGSELEERALSEQIGLRAYYKPLYQSDLVDENAQLLSICGCCLPTYKMNKEQDCIFFKFLENNFK